ncbi:uncharacterized protein LOC100378916 [Saccoglossus kowalevskii]|uniref:Proteoglycan 4-like n=1 Tax=Saccoglossus kowalevskii TaxID=10224 RepID=A0ABM0GSL3_SACKO|nr:PREDICTED: proteoglycan 4-like [Saccoglossus kowalevskii]
MSSDGDIPIPRLCHLVRGDKGYGFNLHGEKGHHGQFIRAVDKDSPAEEAGLKPGDRVIEVNNTNIERENHSQVVARIRAGGNETTLLVVDRTADEYYKKKGITVKPDMVITSNAKQNGTVEAEEIIQTTTVTAEINGEVRKEEIEVVESVPPEAEELPITSEVHINNTPEPEIESPREPEPVSVPEPVVVEVTAVPEPEPIRNIVEETPEPPREPEPPKEPEPEPAREPDPLKEPEPEPAREPEPPKEPEPEPPKEPEPEPPKEPEPEPTPKAVLAPEPVKVQNKEEPKREAPQPQQPKLMILHHADYQETIMGEEVPDFVKNSVVYDASSTASSMMRVPQRRL